ncbi:hypothetical protein ACI2KT_36295 [Ensifer adhaerens]|uniref:Intersectin-EH binding protein Ibp1 n=1 Tax=Ensifer adhaerens TaxID=106592 RepID=A0ABY8HSN2_ENSAD|nr:MULTISPECIES: hypothetical protein [Ensifer]WFP95132.1 hypothetical protein P4B07_29170 [Ensifer adhaerens]
MGVNTSPAFRSSGNPIGAFRSVLNALSAVTVLVSAAVFTQPANAEDKDRCRVASGDDTNQKNLSEKLDDCDGVLKPPRVGDTEIKTPAPDVGKTRVIRPGELQ